MSDKYLHKIPKGVFNMADSNNLEKNCQQVTGVIYMLKNLVNQKCYVGQTVDLKRRLSQHRRSNRPGIDSAIQKYGWKNFTCEVLEECPREMLNEREIFWIAKLDCIVPNGYNCTIGGNCFIGENNPNYGKPRSAETRAKISATLKGHGVSEETRKKIGMANSGRKRTEEEKLKISNSLKGHAVSEETRMLLSELNAGEKNPHYGKSPSEETRAKMSERMTGEKNPFYGKHHTEETRARMSAAKKGRSKSKN